MLDDSKIIQQRDPQQALEVAANQWQQAAAKVEIYNAAHDHRKINNVVVAGMGGSALAALLVKNWLEPVLGVSIEVCRTYELPGYVGHNTLVIASSYSGNTEETLSCYQQAMSSGAPVAVIASGGKLLEDAQAQDVCNAVLPSGMQPRMTTLYGVRAVLKMLSHFGVCSEDYYNQVASYSDWLQVESRQWLASVPTEQNAAKQIALSSVGKTAIFYAGHIMAPVAYKWKISWNENAKNVAFCNELPEFNHNEFMGWASHPVEKPFAVFDLVSQFEHERIKKRFVASERLLSGKRPKANVVSLQGDTVLAQMLWASVLADFASIYTAILNGINPTPVELIEKLKAVLAED